MKTYRIGVIGLGQRIAHVLAAMAEVGWSLEVVAHVDAAPVGAPILAEAGIAPGEALPDFAALLPAGPFDLLIIGSPNHLHLDHLKFALTAGCAVFCEKPIVRTVEESYELAALLAATETPPLYIGLVMRSMPIVREVIARADNGELGELISMDATEHLHPGARRLSRAELAAQAGLGWLLSARQGLPRLRYLRSHRAMAGRSAWPVSAAGASSTRAGTDPPMTYDDGEAAYALRDAGWAGANDPFPLRHGRHRSSGRNRALRHRPCPFLSRQQPCQPAGAALVHRRNPRHAAGRSGAQQAYDPSRARARPNRNGSTSKPAPTTTTMAPIRPWRRDLLAAMEGRATFPGDSARLSRSRPHGNGHRRGAGQRGDDRLPPDVGKIRRRPTNDARRPVRRRRVSESPL